MLTMAARTTKAQPKPASVAAVARRLGELETRVGAIESLIQAAALERQRKTAMALAKNPEQLQQLEEVLRLARKQTPG